MHRATLRHLLATGAGALALFVTLAVATACIRPQPSATPLPISATVQGEGVQVLARLDGDALLVDLESPSGIGKTTITMTAALPVSATLRLHLTGLEHLQISNGVTTLVAQVSSQADHLITQAVAVAPTPVADAQPIAADDPRWLTITLPSATQPYFTVLLPPGFLAQTQQTLSLEWVDFYR
jgi:hypothetical protein